MVNKYVFSDYYLTAVAAVIVSTIYTSQVAFIHFIPCKKKREKNIIKYFYICICILLHADNHFRDNMILSAFITFHSITIKNKNKTYLHA